MKTNIILIGMPGAGKSTVGRLLACELGRPFIDTDELIVRREGKTLAAIIEQQGLASFCEIEERHILSLDLDAHVVATGGSVVYSDRAMDYLMNSGILIYLRVPLDLIRDRIDLGTRGVVIQPGQNLEHLWEERTPLYESYADVVIDCDARPDGQVVAEIIAHEKVRGLRAAQ